MMTAAGKAKPRCNPRDCNGTNDPSCAGCVRELVGPAVDFHTAVPVPEKPDPKTMVE